MNENTIKVLASAHGILNDVALRELSIRPKREYFFGIAERKINGLGRDVVGDINRLADKLMSEWRPMIQNFHPELVRYIDVREKEQRKVGLSATVHEAKAKVISYGTTSYGYDVTLDAKEFKIFSGLNVTEIDPMRFDENCLVNAVVRTDEITGLKYILLPPHSYGLGVTREFFHMPRDVVALCIGKSTYARAGVLINATPIEPGFIGAVVIEIANLTPSPARVYLETGIAQFLFLRGQQPCQTSYGDRGGKYQGQTGVQLPLV